MTNRSRRLSCINFEELLIFFNLEILEKYFFYLFFFNFYFLENKEKTLCFASLNVLIEEICFFLEIKNFEFFIFKIF